MKKLLILLTLIISSFAQQIYYYQKNQKVYLYPIDGALYETFTGAKVQLSGNIIVSFVSGSDAKKHLAQLSKKYEVEYLKKVGYAKPIYLFKSLSDDSIAIANSIHDEPYIKEAYPDMYLVK